MEGSVGVWDPSAQAELEQSVQCDPNTHFQQTNKQNKTIKRTKREDKESNEGWAKRKVWAFIQLFNISWVKPVSAR